MNQFKVPSNSRINRLYDSSFFTKYSSDDNLINNYTQNQVSYYLFCYGSNSLNQLKKRLNKKILKSEKAYLPNYLRIFSGHSNKWNGGTASIIDVNENYYVKGSIVELNDFDLNKLDKFEGANKDPNPYSRVNNIYRRKYVNVIDSNGNKIQSITYIKNNHNWMSYPSEEYLRAVKENIQEYWPELDDSNKLFIYNNNLMLKGFF